MRVALAAASILVLGALLLAGCAGETPVPAPIPTIVTANELQPYRDSALLGTDAVSWQVSGDTTAGLAQPPGARQVVEDAIRSAAFNLAAVPYASLSLPAFVTPTLALSIKSVDFTGQDARLDSWGISRSGSAGWILYYWRGPEVPPHPERPLVNRWVTVYALYDMATGRVVRLVATIRGEALE